MARSVRIAVFDRICFFKILLLDRLELKLAHLSDVIFYAVGHIFYFTIPEYVQKKTLMNKDKKVPKF